MDTQQIIETAEEKLIHTYNRYQIVLDKGDGVRLYDTDGKEYLDFGAGIAVFALGYNNKEYNDALKAQIDKLIHTSKYYYVKNGKADAEIIAMQHSFHGRSMGALAVTGNKHYQEAFGPMIPGIKFAQYNDLNSVKELVNDKTCAIIFETVQGEGGIYPATKEFIEGVRKLCDEKGILLILDEIQCGMGRTGSMFAFQQYGVEPDILTVAKALGCGVPVGAFLAKEEVAKALVPGDHGTTYGGNPLACAAATKVFELFEKQHVLDNVKEVSAYFEEKLDELVETIDVVVERRGMGLMQGLELSVNPKDVIAKALDNGLILFSAGTNVIRFVPPLVITKADVDECIAKLKKSF